MLKRILVFLLFLLLTGNIVSAQNSEDAVGDSELLWVHNFQFFQYDYQLGATLVETGDNCNIWVENNLVTAIVVDEANSIIYAGTNNSGVFSKPVAGDAWTSMSNRFPNSTRSAGVSKVNDLFITSQGQLFCGCDDGMYRWDVSTDEPRWKRESISKPVLCIAENAGVLFAGIGGYVWADDNDEDSDIDIDMGVFTSLDGGSSWDRSSNGIPMDNDDEHLAVYDLEVVESGAVLAATDAGVFLSDNNGAFWKGVERTIVATQANIKLDITESTQDEDVLASLGESIGSLYERLLTIPGIGREDKVVVVEYNDEGEIVRKWTCPPNSTPTTDPLETVKIVPGIVGDEGLWTMRLSYYTRDPETDYLDDYKKIDINDLRYRGEPATATIIDTEKELLLVVSYPDDENFEVGGKFITVSYEADGNRWIWSVKANSLRGLNNEKKGIILDNDHLVFGDDIDNYDVLNSSDVISQMQLSTASGLVFSKLAYQSTDDILFAGSDNGVYQTTDSGLNWELVGSVTEGLENIDIQSMTITKDNALYVGTLDNVFKSTTNGTSWEQIPQIKAQTVIHNVCYYNGNLYAGTPYGFYATSNDGASWSSPNLGMQVFVEPEDIDAILQAFDQSTPADPGKGIYQMVTDQFGVTNVPDTDSNEKIDIFFHDIVEKGREEDQTSNGNYGTTKMTGYFRPEDQNLVGNTNRRDFIYIDSYEATDVEKKSALAHQLMRMIIWNSDYDEERWITEGIAFMGEKLCGYPLPTAMPDFKSLTGPHTVFSLVSGTPLSPWSVSPEDGNMDNRLTISSLFSTFMFENFGGFDLFNQIIEEPENGWIGIQNVLKTQDQELSFDDVYAAWAMAVTINDVDQSDPITGARYGYQDSLYSAALEKNKGDGALAMNSQAIYGHDVSMTDWDGLTGLYEYKEGLNNWAFVIRYFFPDPSCFDNFPDSSIVNYWAKDKTRTDPVTGEPLDIMYHLNANDNSNLRVQLIKVTPEGHVDVENISSTFSDENELSFNVLSKYEPNADNTVLKYHWLYIMISNQDSLGRAAKFIQTKDTTPPVVQYQLVHNPVYPEFVDIMIASNEHNYFDVGDENENPTVEMVYFTDTTAVEISTFDEIPATRSQEGFLFYKGRYHLTEDGDVTLQIRKIQDLAGNDIDMVTSTLTVHKALPDLAINMSTPDKDATLDIAAGSVTSETMLTAHSDKAQAIVGLKKSTDDFAFCSKIYNFGPENKTLNQPAALTIKYNETVDVENTGLFKLVNNQWVAVPADIDKDRKVFMATVEELGTFALLSGNIQNQNVTPAELPITYAVYQNYPNPFNPSTEIKYQLPRDGHVDLNIYNMRGQLVSTLVNHNMDAGYHTVRWNGTSNAGTKVSSGVYFYKITAGSFSETKKMILIK